nr:hypothetical protein [Terrimonas sp.]
MFSVYNSYSKFFFLVVCLLILSRSSFAQTVNDTTAPNPPVVANLTTFDTTPTLTGSAEAGSTVTIIVYAVTYTTTADGSGN